MRWRWFDGGDVLMRLTRTLRQTQSGLLANRTDEAGARRERTNLKVKEVLRLIHIGFLLICTCGFHACTSRWSIMLERDGEILPNVTLDSYIRTAPDSVFVFVIKNRTSDTVYYDDRFFFSEFCCDSIGGNCNTVGLKILDPIMVSCDFKKVLPKSKVSLKYKIPNCDAHWFRLRSEFPFYVQNPIDQLCENDFFSSSHLLNAFTIEFHYRGLLESKKIAYTKMHAAIVR